MTARVRDSEVERGREAKRWWVKEEDYGTHAGLFVPAHVALEILSR